MRVDATGSQKSLLLRFIRHGIQAALDVGCGAGEKTALIAGHVATTVWQLVKTCGEDDAQNR